MKFILQKDSLFQTNYQGKFIYREGRLAEIDSDLLEALKGNEKEDRSVRERLQDAREKAILSADSFGQEIIDEIRATENNISVDEGAKSVQQLKENTRESIFDILDSSPPSSPLASRSTPEGFADLVDNLRDGSSRVELTVMNTQSAMETLNQLRTRYELDAKGYEDELATGLEYQSRWNLLRGHRVSQRSHAEAFKLRNSFVMDVFGDLDNKLKEHYKTAESMRDEAVERMGSRFKNLSLREQSEFLGFVQDEIKNGTDLRTTLAGRPELLDLIHGTNQSQRLEAFRELNFDNSDLKKVLKTVNKHIESLKGRYNNQKESTKEIRIDSDHYKAVRSALAVDEEIPSLDKEGSKSLLSRLVPAIQDVLTDQKSKDISDIFENAGFQNSLDLSDSDSFLVFLKHFSTTEGKESLNNMTKDLKKDILTYLNFIESVTVEEDNGFSAEFIEFENKEIKNHFDESAVMFEALDKSKTLKDIEDKSLKKLDDYITSSVVIERKINSYLEDEDLNEDEKAVLNEYINKVNKLKEVAKEVKEKYKEEIETFKKEEEKRFKEQTEEYKKEQKDYEQYEKEKTALIKLINELKWSKKGSGDLIAKVETKEDKSSKEKNKTTQSNKDQVQANLEKRKNAYGLYLESKNNLLGLKSITEPTKVEEKKDLKDQKVETKITGLYTDDLANLKVDISELKDRKEKKNKKERKAKKGVDNLIEERKSNALRFLKAEANTTRNENLLDDLEIEREKHINLMINAEIGSSFSIGFVDYTPSGLPPTASTILTKTPETRACKLLAKTEDGVVLYSKEKKQLIFYQNIEGRDIEMIFVPAPDLVDEEGIPADFDPGSDNKVGASMFVRNTN